MNTDLFFKDFIDYLSPRLDTYEQAIYLYLFRHTRLIGRDEAVIGFKSARSRMACGIGEKGKPMSESTASEKLQSLQNKGCIVVLDSNREGRRISVKLPSEIPGVVVAAQPALSLDLEAEDFFEEEENRPRILAREEHKCFYCLRPLNKENYVIEHVVSRPEGNNTYRNVVAACRRCNNRKKAFSAEEWLRVLYRENFLGETEFQDRMQHLVKLRAGELKPPQRIA